MEPFGFRFCALDHLRSLYNFYRMNAHSQGIEEMSKQLRNAADIARMATDTLSGLNKIDKILALAKVGLITEAEALDLL